MPFLSSRDPVGLVVNTWGRLILWFGASLIPVTGWGAETGGAPDLLGAGPSFVRLFGALALVLGLVFGGYWFIRNGIRWAPRGVALRRLKVVEGRVLGHRQSLLVVGYDDQRFLVASSPAGVTFLTHLPPSDAGDGLNGDSPAESAATFGDALRQVLVRRG